MQAGGRDDAAFLSSLSRNEVRLWLSPLLMTWGIYGGGWRCPRRSESRSLTSLQQRLVKSGGRLIQHARYHDCCWPRGI
jgi:hypothetical protein